MEYKTKSSESEKTCDVAVAIPVGNATHAQHGKARIEGEKGGGGGEGG